MRSFAQKQALQRRMKKLRRQLSRQNVYVCSNQQADADRAAASLIAELDLEQQRISTRLQKKLITKPKQEEKQIHDREVAAFISLITCPITEVRTLAYLFQLRLIISELCLTVYCVLQSPIKDPVILADGHTRMRGALQRTG